MANLDWSPDSAQIAIGTFENQIWLINAGSGAIERRFEAVSGAPGAIRSAVPAAFRLVAFAPDGRTLAVYSHQQITLWRIR